MEIKTVKESTERQAGMVPECHAIVSTWWGRIHLMGIPCKLGIVMSGSTKCWSPHLPLVLLPCTVDPPTATDIYGLNAIRIPIKAILLSYCRLTLTKITNKKCEWEFEITLFTFLIDRVRDRDVWMPRICTEDWYTTLVELGVVFQEVHTEQKASSFLLASHPIHI
jgi:hypothetical protein